MISYSIHLKHMMDAARRIENPSAALYKKMRKFIRDIKKRKYKFRLGWGKVYTFMYAAKTAKKLPYYDRYPMVLVMERNQRKGYFDGLNLHYINPYFRTLLLRGIEHLLLIGADRYMVKEFNQAVTRLVKRIAMPCRHRYRMDRIINMRILQIPCALPQHFGGVKDETYMKSGLRRVWLDSIKMIIRGAKWKLKRENKKRALKSAKRHAEAAARARSSSLKIKAKHGRPSRKSETARKSKARTGRKYRG